MTFAEPLLKYLDTVWKRVMWQPKRLANTLPRCSPEKTLAYRVDFGTRAVRETPCQGAFRCRLRARCPPVSRRIQSIAIDYEEPKHLPVAPHLPGSLDVPPHLVPPGHPLGRTGRPGFGTFALNDNQGIGCLDRKSTRLNSS